MKIRAWECLSFILNQLIHFSYVKFYETISLLTKMGNFSWRFAPFSALNAAWMRSVMENDKRRTTNLSNNNIQSCNCRTSQSATLYIDSPLYHGVWEVEAAQSHGSERIGKRWRRPRRQRHSRWERAGCWWIFLLCCSQPSALAACWRLGALYATAAMLAWSLVYNNLV